ENAPPTYQPYAEVKEQIEQELIGAKRAAVMRDFQQELWTKYHVVVHQEVLQAVVQEAQGNSPPWQPQRPVTQAQKPRLELLSTAYNLGAIPTETITHTSLVTNSGDAELVIKRVHTT